MSDGICFNILTYSPIKDEAHGFHGNIGVVGLILAIIYFMNACVMIFFIYLQRRKAQDGMEGAALYVIFPIYLPFMLVSVLSDALVGAVIFLLKVNLLHPNPWGSSVAIAAVYGIQHFVLEGIAFTMMQYGCGFQAARRSALWALGWALTTFCVQLLVNREGNTDAAYSASFLWNFTLVVFYFSLWLVPEKKMFRRPSVIFYAQVWSIYRVLFLVSETMIKFSTFASTTYVTGYCAYAFGNVLLCALFKPFVVYKTLLSDSIWWQGVGGSKRTKSKNDITLTTTTESSSNHSSNSKSSYGGSINPLHGNFSEGDNKKIETKTVYEQLRNPLLGVEVGFSEAQELAQEVDKLRAQGTVRLLNFAYLSIQKKAPLLGSGSFSKVYLGRYRKQPVAIKMLFTPDLNPDVIRGCTNEAQILSGIRHENVVEIYGIAVLPPSVCIVLERCNYGSLSDVIRGSEGMNSTTMPLPLSRSDRIFLALGCARGLEALHNFSSTLCHRDIKSFNFLVDGQLIAKIADLELGVNCEQGDITSLHMSSENATTSSWQAPEVISTGNYTQASDVYSLALVLWEIIATSKISFGNPQGFSSPTKPGGGKFSSSTGSGSALGKGGLPFAEFASQSEIKKMIINGERPQIPTGFNIKFTDCLTRAWNVDPFLRPNATEVASIMYQSWTECLHGHIFETKHIVDLVPIKEACEHFMLNREGHRVSLSEAARHPPTAAMLSALLPMQLERRWMRLEEEGAFVIISAEAPFYILWATKKWSKLTGYLINEVLSFHISLIMGPQKECERFLKALENVLDGNSVHLVCSNYRRDKSGYRNSIHMFPVYEASLDSPNYLSESRNQSTDSLRSVASTTDTTYLKSAYTSLTPVTGTGTGGYSSLFNSPSHNNTISDYNPKEYSLGSSKYQRAQSLSQSQSRSQSHASSTGSYKSPDFMHLLSKTPENENEHEDDVDVNGNLNKPVAINVEEEDCIDIEINGINTQHLKPVDFHHQALPPLAPDNAELNSKLLLHQAQTNSTLGNIPISTYSPSSTPGSSSSSVASHRFSPLTFATYLFGDKKVNKRSSSDQKIAYIAIQFTALHELQK